jgi:beta-galactosidase
MTGISRRDLIYSGLALSASSFIPSAWAGAAVLAGTPEAAGDSALATIGPREQLLFDLGWKFHFGNVDEPARDFGFGQNQSDFSKMGDFKFARVGYDDATWRTLSLPHDWAVELPFVRDEDLQSHGYKPLGRRYPETSVGWYRREFEIPASDAGRRITVEFDGAFRDVFIFVNGFFVGRNDNGYTPFRFDITDFLAIGATNCVVVRVDASYGDGWFYEGAGIYRHVWLTKTEPMHLGRWECWVRAEVKGENAALLLGTTVVNEGNKLESASVNWEILDPAGKTVATAEAPEQPVAPDGSTSFKATASIVHPALWSLETPNLYSAIVRVKSGGKVPDAERVSFGLRTVRFDPEHGFFLNGQSMKIQGTCNHQDHAGVGMALPDRLHDFRIGVLKGMGCNAVRTSHNMPTPEFVEACDRMGMMMMCETRQMSSSPEGMAQLEVMIKRFRNSPSIIIWSIGNEEDHLQTDETEQGAKIAATMVRLCHELDPTRVVSAAVNGDNENGLSKTLDVVGFNYQLNYPDVFHNKHSTRPVYGSETASTFSTRGCYETDSLRNTISAYDVNHPKWGESAEEWWTFYATREWEAGGFAWTGFDYRGEPTPYGWPSINSQFGIVDICGFPKDNFFYYKAWWTKEPVLHLFPHWNFAGREGREILVWVHSNLDEVELFLNGKSQGRQKVPLWGHVEWRVRYQPGAIEAQGWKDGTMVLTEKRETTGDAVSLRLTADRTTIDADGEDVTVLTVEALDSAGRAVPIASNNIRFKITGDGALIGVGNGDPNCHESDKDPQRSLFNGLAQAIVQSTKTAGEIHIEASGSGGRLTPDKLSITTRRVPLRPAVKESPYIVGTHSLKESITNAQYLQVRPRAIVGVGLVAATTLLAMKAFKKGNNTVSLGFLIFAIGSAVMLSGVAAPLDGSVPSFAAAAALWSLALLLTSIPRGFAAWIRASGILTAIFFALTAVKIYRGHLLSSISFPFPMLAYPFLFLTVVGWFWSLFEPDRRDDAPCGPPRQET